MPFPLIVISAALIGYLGNHYAPRLFSGSGAHKGVGKHFGKAVIDDDSPTPAHAHFSWHGLVKFLVVGIMIWLLGMASLTALYGCSAVYTQMAWFFTKAALLTFGGAYAVLPYVYQGAVTHYSWLTSAQMMDGLALGESTPGPLIMVVAFVGFVGGWSHATLASPLVAGVLAVLTLFFALHVFWPNHLNIDWLAMLAAVIGFVALYQFKVNTMRLIGVFAIFGLLYTWFYS